MGFKLEDRLTKPPRPHVRGGSQFHSRTFDGKIPAQSGAAEELEQNQSWGNKTTLRPPTTNTGRCVTFLRRLSSATLPGSILYFFFFFSCAIKHPYKRQISLLGMLNPKEPFLIFWNKLGRVSPLSCAVTRRGTLDVICARTHWPMILGESFNLSGYLCPCSVHRGW